MSNFKNASRLKLRFQTEVGNLSTEQLWDLTISQLDSLAIRLENEYKESGKKSFVVKKSRKDKTAKLRFDIVLDVLTTKVEERDTASSARETKEHNAKIDAMIAAKQNEEMSNMSIEELEGLRK